MLNPTIALILSATLLVSSDPGGSPVPASAAASRPADDRPSSANTDAGRLTDQTTQRPTETDTFYDPQTVQEIHLQVPPAELDRMQAALPKRIFVPATFRWGRHTLNNVGVRYKGNSSSNPRQTHKRSFLVKFNEFTKDHRFLGLERVSFDNGVQFGSLFSEQLITAVLHDLGITAPRCNFAKLYLNGRFHGVYVNVERIDRVFLKTHFTDASGALYKVDEGGPGANLAPFPSQPGENDRRRHTFEPKSKSASPEARDVLELISRIHNTPPKDFSQALHDNLEVDDFLQTMAVLLFAGAFDQLTGWNPHNYYLYHQPRTDRWHYIPWDLDVGFADNAFGRLPILTQWNAAWPIPGGPPKPLIQRIVDDPQLLARYRRFADQILEQHFHPKIMLPRIDALYARIKADLEKDPFPHRRATNPEDQSFDSIIASFKQFVRQRYALARAQLNDPGKRPQFPTNRQPHRQGPQPGQPSPDAPTQLIVVAITAQKVTLRWKDNAQGEAGHLVQRTHDRDALEFRNHIGRPGPDSSTAADTRVEPGRRYRYRVYAVHPTPDGQRGTGVSNVITVHVPDK